MAAHRPSLTGRPAGLRPVMPIMIAAPEQGHSPGRWG